MAVLLDRISREFASEIAGGGAEILIVTTPDPENKDFEAFSGAGVSVFYGNRDNIPLRHLECARAHGLDALVSVDGDDILCSAAAMREVYEALKQGADYAATSGLPLGMNVHGYRASFLEKSIEGHGSGVLETGWGRIFDPAAKKEIPMALSGAAENLRFTLDYEADFEFFARVIEGMGEAIADAADEEIVRFVEEHGLAAVNAHLNDEYFENFNRMVAEESG